MYEPDTILTLKEQREPDEETGEEFPYNCVKVIGPSPINHGVANAEWSGANGAGVIITPLSNFGSTLDEPYGKLVALYDVTEIPVREADLTPKIRVINSTSQSAGPTPEEVFSVEAPGVPPEEGQRRGRTTVSPLEDPRPKANDGPLGPVPAAKDED
jgi:hypothetical protein